MESITLIAAVRANKKQDALADFAGMLDNYGQPYLASYEAVPVRADEDWFGDIRQTFAESLERAVFFDLVGDWYEVNGEWLAAFDSVEDAKSAHADFVNGYMDLCVDNCSDQKPLYLIFGTGFLSEESVRS